MQIKAQRGVPQARYHGAIGLFIALLLATGIGGKLLPALRDVLPFVATTGIFAVMAFVFYSMMPRYVGLEVGGGRLVVGASEGEWSLRGAILGPLRSIDGTGVGTVLHLADGPRALRIGSMGHRVENDAHSPAPPVMAADLYIAPQELEAIVSLLGPPSPSIAAGGEVVRVRLVPHRASAWGLVKQMLPSAVVLAFVGAATLILPSEVTDGLVAQAVLGVLAMAVFFGTVAWMMVRAFRGVGGRVLEITPQDVRLFDVGGTRLLGQSARSAVGISRAMHAIHLRHGGTFPYPSLTLRWPGQPPLSVGVLDLRYAWADVHSTESAPRYAVGFPDWEALVDALKWRPRLRMSQWSGGPGG